MTKTRVGDPFEGLYDPENPFLVLVQGLYGVQNQISGSVQGL